MNVSKTIVLESGTRLTPARLEPPDGLWERIALLRPDDRTLLELSLRAGASYRVIGRALKRSPGSVSRAIRRLGRRLHDPLVVGLLHRDCPLDPVYRQIAVEHFLTGLSVPELSRKHERSIPEVRRIVHFVRTWHRGIGRARHRGNA
jgi:DNA-directed RNA polymerase specialized sigma24 family protein